MHGQENRSLLVEREFPVKTYDIDFARHVSNVTYIRWLEDLRLAVFTVGDRLCARARR